MSNLKIGPVDITAGTAKLDAHGLQVGTGQLTTNTDGSVIIANNTVVDGSSISVKPGQVNSAISLSSSMGFTRSLTFKTGTTTRWSLYTSADQEIGGNLGSNLLFANYSDAGNYVSTVMEISRSDGAVTINNALKIPTLDVAVSDSRAASSAYVKNCLLSIQDRATGDSSNAAANTRFVQNAISSTSGGSKVTTFNNRTGAITLTSADVINALGYTPVSPGNVVTGIRVGTPNGPSIYWGATKTGIVNFAGGFRDMGSYIAPPEVSNNSGWCIHPQSLISMNDGSVKFACDVRPGDILQGNNKVLGLMNSVLSDRSWIEINNKAVITSDHLVKLSSGWAVKSKEQYESHYQNKTFACKTLKGMRDLSGDFGDADTFSILSTGLALSTGEELTTLKEFYGAPHHPVISLYTEQDSFFADGIEVASMGKDLLEE